MFRLPSGAPQRHSPPGRDGSGAPVPPPEPPACGLGPCPCTGRWTASRSLPGHTGQFQRPLNRAVLTVPAVENREAKSKATSRPEPSNSTRARFPRSSRRVQGTHAASRCHLPPGMASSGLCKHTTPPPGVPTRDGAGTAPGPCASARRGRTAETPHALKSIRRTAPISAIFPSHVLSGAQRLS